MTCTQVWPGTSDLICECANDVLTTLVATTTLSAGTASCKDLQDVERQCSSNGCKVLAGGMTGRTCDDYCSSHGLSCTGAWEEVNENCDVKEVMTCTQVWPGTSDLICECEPARRLSPLKEESEDAFGFVGGVIGVLLGILAMVVVVACLRWRHVGNDEADGKYVQVSRAASRNSQVQNHL